MHIGLATEAEPAGYRKLGAGIWRPEGAGQTVGDYRQGPGCRKGRGRPGDQRRKAGTWLPGGPAPARRPETRGRDLATGRYGADQAAGAERQGLPTDRVREPGGRKGRGLPGGRSREAGPWQPAGTRPTRSPKTRGRSCRPLRCENLADGRAGACQADGDERQGPGSRQGRGRQGVRRRETGPADRRGAGTWRTEGPGPARRPETRGRALATGMAGAGQATGDERQGPGDREGLDRTGGRKNGQVPGGGDGPPVRAGLTRQHGKRAWDPGRTKMAMSREDLGQTDSLSA